MVEKPSKLAPALVGGLILGILSAIPFVNLGNACCCMWVLIGGIVAAKMLINQSPVLPVRAGDGAAVGALAGAIGAAVNLVLGVPLALLLGSGIQIGLMQSLRNMMHDNPDAQAQIDQAIRQMQYTNPGERLVSALVYWMIFAVITVAFATLGGTIGVALFEKRKGQPPAGPGGFAPPPPPGPGSWAPPPQG